MVLFLAPEVYLPLRRVGAAYHASVEGVAAVQAALDIVDAARPKTGRVAGIRRPGINRCDRPHRLLPRTFDAGYRRTSTLSSRRASWWLLVGPSGCGKSTLLSVLLKFREPDAGQVLVDGVDLAEIDPQSWRQMIGWVGQRPHLFAASVADNIRLGRPGATDDQVRYRPPGEQRRKALSLRFRTVSRPSSASTAWACPSVSDSVLRLLARFCGTRHYLLLDEPTASLDAEAAEIVADSLTSLAGRRTVLFTSHRPALFMRADRTIFDARCQPLLVAVGTEHDVNRHNVRRRPSTGRRARTACGCA